MSEFNTEQVIGAFLNKMYSDLMTPYTGHSAPANRILMFAMPPLVLGNKFFEFAEKGIGDDRERLQRAADWSTIANFIPEISKNVYDAQQQAEMANQVQTESGLRYTAFNPDGRSIYSVYKAVLDFCQVPNVGEPSAEEQETIAELREFLARNEDIYDTYMKKYLDKRDEYNALRIPADAGEPGAIREWRIKGNRLEDEVFQAYRKWQDLGLKDKYENYEARIRNMEGFHPGRYVEELRNNVRRLENDPSTGPFPFTTIVPGNVASIQWNTRFFSYENASFYQNQSQSNWGATGGFLSGFFAAGTGAGNNQRKLEVKHLETLKISYDCTSVIIKRDPWFTGAVSFLTSNWWQFDPDMPELKNLTEMLCDGPPKYNGSLPGMALRAHLVRNMTVEIKDLTEVDSELKREIDTKGGFQLGPFAFGGKYRHSTSTVSKVQHSSDDAYTAPELQVVALDVAVHDLMPNPMKSDDIEWTDVLSNR